MPNKVVVHYLNGTIERGYTSDFHPQHDMFHLVIQKDDRDKSLAVKMDDLKGIFFVKELEGKNKDVEKIKKTFDDEEFKYKTVVGKKIKVVFTDGEVQYGLTIGYSQERRGFFFTPIDSDSNNERIFAIWSAVKDIKFYD